MYPALPFSDHPHSEHVFHFVHTATVDAFGNVVERGRELARFQLVDHVRCIARVVARSDRAGRVLQRVALKAVCTGLFVEVPHQGFDAAAPIRTDRTRAPAREYP